jgi:hypothetical protein
MEYFDLFVLRMVSKRILTYINKNNTTKCMGFGKVKINYQRQLS